MGSLPMLLVACILCSSLLVFSGNGAHATSPSPLTIDGSAFGGCINDRMNCSSAISTSKGNDLIVVFTQVALNTDPGHQCTFTVRDTAGLPWRLRASSAGRNEGYGNRDQIAEFWAISPTPLSNDVITETITVCGPSFNGGQYNGFFAIGVNGANINQPFDPNASVPGSANGSGSTASIPLSTTNPNDMLLGWAQGYQIATGSGFTLIGPPVPLVGAATIAAEYRVVNAPVTNLPVNFSISKDWWEEIADAIQPGLSNGLYPDFTMTSAPSTSSIGFGQNASYTITIRSINNFTGTLQLSTNVPPGGTISPALSLSATNLTLSAGGSGSSVLLVQSYLLTRTGTFTFYVNATIGYFGHHVAVQLTVAPPISGADFLLSADPIVAYQADIAAVTVNGTVTVTSIGGFSSRIVLSGSGPNPTNVSFTPNTVLASPVGQSVSVMTVKFPAGYYWYKLNRTITVQGTSGGVVHSLQVTVNFVHTTIVETVSQSSFFMKPGAVNTTLITFRNDTPLSAKIIFSGRIDNSNSPLGPAISWSPAVNSILLLPQGSYTARLQVQVYAGTPARQFILYVEAFADTGWYHNVTIPVYVTLHDTSPGVASGTTVTYQFTSNQFLGALEARITILNSNGTRVNYQADYLLNGVLENSTISWIDILTGEMSSNTLIPTILVAKNLAAGETPYLEPSNYTQSPPTLNSQKILVIGGYRYAIGITVYSYPSIVTVNWDRATGLLLDASVSGPFVAHYTLISTNAWSPLSGNLKLSRTSGNIPLAIDLQAQASGGQPGYTYHWDFGDGKASTQQNVSHTYAAAGNYTVTLTITDSAGNKVTKTTIVNAQQSLAPSLASPFQALRFSLGGIPLLIIGAWIMVSIVVSVLVVLSEERKRRRLSVPWSPPLT